MSAITEAAIRPDFRVIGIDETRHYNIPEEDRPYIDKILGVYLYDKNEVTRLCEFTPSYFLRHLYDTIVLTEEGHSDSWLGDRLEQAYCYCESDDIYMHCSDVDLLETQVKKTPWRYHVVGDPFPDLDVEDEEQGYRQMMDSTAEYYDCNRMV
jgi:hypothetical protein